MTIKPLSSDSGNVERSKREAESARAAERRATEERETEQARRDERPEGKGNEVDTRA